jgi:glycosyltransferase involved in cell wall biosynthesis
MRILVDYRSALRQRTGVGEYIHSLIRAYQQAARNDTRDDVTVFTSSWSDRPQPGLGAELQARVVDRRIPVRVLNYLWHRAEWPPAEMLAGPADVVHAAHPLLIPARRAAQVVTIHDLHFLSHPERTSAEIRRDYPALAADHARRAHAIVTSTEYAARLVVETFGVSRDRIYVCAPGAPSWTSLGRQPHVPADGYVLWLGTMEPRKNLGVLLDAYEQLAARRAAVPRLVLAGAVTPGAAPWLDRIARAPLSAHVTHRGYVSAADREQLFAGARALVLPSLEEGFGLTALEAMSAGIPLIASNRGSLPEVVGAGGVLLDAEDAAGFADAIERIGSDAAWAAQQGAAGLERAKTFTWTEAAARLRQAYVGAIRRRDTQLNGPPEGGHY